MQSTSACTQQFTTFSILEQTKIQEISWLSPPMLTILTKATCWEVHRGMELYMKSSLCKITNHFEFTDQCKINGANRRDGMEHVTKDILSLNREMNILKHKRFS